MTVSEVPELEFPGPAPLSQEQWPQILLKPRPITFGHEIIDAQLRDFLGAAEADQPAPCRIHIGGSAGKIRDADEVRGPFDKRGEAMLAALRIPAVKTDRSLVGCNVKQETLPGVRKRRIKRPHDDHGIATETNSCRSDVQPATAEWIGYRGSGQPSSPWQPACDCLANTRQHSGCRTNPGVSVLQGAAELRRADGDENQLRIEHRNEGG